METLETTMSTLQNLETTMSTLQNTRGTLINLSCIKHSHSKLKASETKNSNVVTNGMQTFIRS